MHSATSGRRSDRWPARGRAQPAAAPTLGETRPSGNEPLPDRLGRASGSSSRSGCSPRSTGSSSAYHSAARRCSSRRSTIPTRRRQASSHGAQPSTNTTKIGPSPQNTRFIIQDTALYQSVRFEFATRQINEFFAGDQRILLGLRETISTEMRAVRCQPVARTRLTSATRRSSSIGLLRTGPAVSSSTPGIS
jgi:hypothetical protein